MAGSNSFSITPKFPVFVEGIEASVIASFLSLTRGYRVVRCDESGRQGCTRRQIRRLLRTQTGIAVVGYFSTQLRLEYGAQPRKRETRYFKCKGVRVVSVNSRGRIAYNLPVIFHDLGEPVSQLLGWLDRQAEKAG